MSCFVLGAKLLKWHLACFFAGVGCGVACLLSGYVVFGFAALVLFAVCLALAFRIGSLDVILPEAA